MVNPKFSIVVCCWNSFRYIADCIKSIESQSFDDYEVIFVDGGSDDGTLDLINKVHCKKKVLKNIRGGISKAMNAGGLAASGDYIVHLHADDFFWDSNALKIVSEVIFGNNNPAWLYGKFYNLCDGVISPPPYPFKEFSLSNLRRRNIVPHCATFLKRDIFVESGGFSEKYRLAMDYDLWLRLSKKHQPIQIYQYLSVFRRHSESSTSKFSLKSFNEDFKARFLNSPLHLWPEFVLRYFYRRIREV